MAGRVEFYKAGEPFRGGPRPARQAIADLNRFLRRQGEPALLVESFYGVESHPVFPEKAKDVQAAIRHRDAAGLYRVTYAYAPFFCPDCAAVYCGDHWDWRRFEDEAHSGVEGPCPKGHFHVMMY